MILAIKFLSKNVVLLSIFLVPGILFSLSQLPDLTTDNTIPVWLENRSDDYKKYLDFIERHGDDKWALVTISQGKIDSEKLANDCGLIVDSLRNQFDAVEVITPFEKENPKSQQLKPILQSEDGRVIALLIRFDKIKKELSHSETMKRINGILSGYLSTYKFHLWGSIVLNDELDQTSKSQSRIFFSVALAFSLLVLWLTNRSLPCATAAIITGLLTVLTTLGTISACGAKLNMVTTILPVLLWIISINGSIHMIGQFQTNHSEGQTFAKTLEQTLSRILLPLCLANLTTAAGFLSLLTSSMPPVRDLGTYSAIGIAIGFLANLIILPSLLKLILRWHSFPESRPTQIRALGMMRPCLGGRLKWGFMIIAVAIAGFPLAGFSSLRTESSVMKFFRADSKIVQDYEFISQNLTGLSTIELDIQGEYEDCSQFVLELEQRLRSMESMKRAVLPAESGVRVSLFIDTIESFQFNRIVKSVRDIIADI